MKKTSKVIFIVIILMIFLVPFSSVNADPTSSIIDNNKDTIEQTKKVAENSNKTENEKQETQKTEDVVDCYGIFGDPSKEDSTIYMIQKVLNYIKVLAPLLVVLLSGIDFAKNAMSGDQDEMKKATKKLVTRLACAVGVFLAPFLTGFIINFINKTSRDTTCNIK